MFNKFGIIQIIQMSPTLLVKMFGLGQKVLSHLT